MSSTRLHPHHSLPAPVVHAAFSISKSHVLAGVQDAYWSDDEAEDAECPLCLEEMDISDLNFKPCICGYQICRFCWHHIKENLNKRCPACRRVYTDDAVEFKPIATQDHKRLTQQKKQRDREKKDLEALGRKQLANVRVVQRNVVYVVGIGPRFAKEELIPTLRSNEYFGQYGKITKILLVKRNSPGGGGVPVVGLYITYHRREDAARVIAAVDGTQSPGGGRDIMRASYGTTKYCMAFLRGVPCSDHSCMNLHEWGDEKDCFTKEDLTTLKHTMKATESRTRTVATKKGDEDAGLPRAASWAQKGSGTVPSSVGSNPNTISSSMLVPPRQTRRTGPVRPPRNIVNTGSSSTNESRPSTTKVVCERKLISLSSSRPSTPADANRVDGTSELKTTKMKESVVPSLPNSPVPSTTTSDQGSAVQEMPPPMPIRPDSTDSSQSNHRPPSTKLPHVPLVPPGLAAPPGISSPSRPPRAETASPQTPLLASHSSYQMSTAARALLDDVKARRESALPISSGLSPFPDFDRTLQTLSGEDGGGFSFNLDPKLADEVDSAENLPDFDMTSTIPFHGSYLDAFPALRSGSTYTHPPSLGYPQSVTHPIYDPSAARSMPGSLLEKQTARGTSYLGSFNPFSEPSVDDVMSSPSPSLRSSYSPIDEERKVSRFGFARGRQSSTATSSPLHSMAPLNYSSDLQPLHHSPDDLVHPWPPGLHDIRVPSPLSGSPLPHCAQAQPIFAPHQSHLQSLSGGDLSEAQLRSFIQSSQERENVAHARRTLDFQQLQFRASQPFEDPAIMSASFAPPTSIDLEFPSYGPPPGLPVPSPGLLQVHQSGGMTDRRNSSTQVSSVISTPPTLLSPEDFPALGPSASDPAPVAHQPEPSGVQDSSIILKIKDQEKADRRAAKKAVAAEKALERQRAALEKAEAKAAEKAKVSREKAAEKEKVSSLKQSSTQVSSEKASTAVMAPSPPPVSHSEKNKAVRHETERTLTSKKSHSRVIDSVATSKRQDQAQTPKLATRPASSAKVPTPSVKDSNLQVPLLSKKPKKNKPISKPVKVLKEEELHDELFPPSTTDISRMAGFIADSSSTNSRSHSVECKHTPTSVQELLEKIDAITPGMDLVDNPFFDVQRLTSPAKMPLEYGPLVHALSALSVGGGSFANNMPSGSIDNAVSSFQQLLETLTQTISDLLRLLPRTTWDDSSSFDGVLRDMLKGDDFLDDGEEGPGKDDEVAALTLALERRARWMEVQLSKLEELHRDINTAAVRAILSFNDNGWDRHGFLPRIGNTLRRFDHIGMLEQNGEMRMMSADELEKKLAVAKEAAVFAEMEIREAMERSQISKSGGL